VSRIQTALGKRLAHLCVEWSKIHGSP
jgi:hypothetical protein